MLLIKSKTYEASVFKIITLGYFTTACVLQYGSLLILDECFFKENYLSKKSISNY